MHLRMGHALDEYREFDIALDDDAEETEEKDWTAASDDADDEEDELEAEA